MKKKIIYIIEHLEPELFEWCFFEYKHISKIVGKNNLWFTNIQNEKDVKKLAAFGKVLKESVQTLKLDNACVLDPEADKTLEPNENFDYLIFGGILGDYPPKKRTNSELGKFLPNAEKRNVGKEQMSTDNAVYTAKQIAENGKKFEELKFLDNASIEINEFESVELPYRYNLADGKPLISKEVINYLKTKKGF